MATNKDYGSVSKLNSERDGLTAIKMVRDMGKVSTWFQSVGDPCRPPFKCDDLAKGYGVPKGFKGMNFFVTPTRSAGCLSRRRSTGSASWPNRKG
jgi:hypothetical protein